MEADKDNPIVMKPSHSSVKESVRRLQTDHSLSFEEVDHLQTTLAAISKSRRYTHYKRKPWMDEDGNLVWSPSRIMVAKVVFSQTFETCMGLIICFNLGIIVYEADMDATCHPAYTANYSECPQRADAIPFVGEINIMLLVIYSIECAIRFFVERGDFLCNAWNLVDLLTVVLGWSSMALSMLNFSLLRLARLVRVLRAARVFISVPEFYLLVSGLYSSMKAILFGSLILVSVIGFWAVIAVEMLHPIVASIQFTSCERCHGGFRSVLAASVTLFQQIVAGDSWGEISVPLIETAPETTPILFAIMVTVSLGVMNLILAVIVERATEARENDHDRKLKKKEVERSKNMTDFAVLCHDMDKDGSGSLSLDEMLKGYDENESFSKLMGVMDIHRDDMQTIFRVLDTDWSGEVSYLEFCQHLAGFFERDPTILQSLLKYSILEVRKMISVDVQGTLREHTKMLREQQRLLERLTASSSPLPVKKPPKVEVSFGPESEYLPPLQGLAGLQTELQPLLGRAERLLEEAMRASRAWSADGGEGQEPVMPPSPAGKPNEKYTEASLAEQLDRQFAELCSSFQDRFHEAESLQGRCKEMLEHLTDLRRDALSGHASYILSVQV
ncbi:unnamed protein product [Effrenium voratum]|uniref:EF-hand domain-containing protein n=1 Tax=Effrenium voratum TaxID=2562239 RepID=A0AA36IGR0_9DINO|nr:unnamed protein product [Effrenium voratum]CAJ1424469.1 unnamed protein product [Effrenium voratum]